MGVYNDYILDTRMLSLSLLGNKVNMFDLLIFLLLKESQIYMYTERVRLEKCHVTTGTLDPDPFMNIAVKNAQISYSHYK